MLSLKIFTTLAIQFHVSNLTGKYQRKKMRMVMEMKMKKRKK